MMRRTLYKRLGHLERVTARALQQIQHGNAESIGERFRNKIDIFLRLRGTERQSHESLAEALARALEIDCVELRRQLGAGIDPIHKYFTDHGVFEEIERMKAAGTWPAAQEGRE